MTTGVPSTGLAKPAWPYSNVVRWGDLVFLSGQVPRDPRTGEIVNGDMADQAKQMFENVRMLLEVSGVGFADVVKTTVFLTDMSQFTVMNEVYAQYFQPPYPARSTVAVTGLPLGASMEIEVIAAKQARDREAA